MKAARCLPTRARRCSTGSAATRRRMDQKQSQPMSRSRGGTGLIPRRWRSPSRCRGHSSQAPLSARPLSPSSRPISPPSTSSLTIKSLRTSSRSILTIRTHALDSWARASALLMPRLFSAIEIPRPLAERLTLLRAGLTGARWIDPENYHLTLRFIGDVDGSTAREFAEALGGIEVPAFELRLNGLGSFGGHKPRAIFAGIAPSDGLDALRRANERAAREAGLPPEGRNFKPHVTLARLRNARADAVAAYLEHQGGIAAEPFTVSRFVLYSSRNSVGGGPYVVEAAYPLED